MEAPKDAVPVTTGGDVYFVLERATLEPAKVGKDYAMLNCDDHSAFLRKHKRDPANYRPDILHQARPPQRVAGPPPELALLPGAACHLRQPAEQVRKSKGTAGGVDAGLRRLTRACWTRQGIFVHTEKNVLFSVSPATRIPRTFRRFCGLMRASRASSPLSCLTPRQSNCCRSCPSAPPTVRPSCCASSSTR